VWEVLLDALGTILAGDRHGDVRTYDDGERALRIAVSRGARRAIHDQGNRVWIWAESSRGLALVEGDAAAPARQRRFVRFDDQDDREGFVVMLDEEVDPLGFVIRRKPWPFQGLSVFTHMRL
jgi:hypothetical protein